MRSLIFLAALLAPGCSHPATPVDVTTGNEFQSVWDYNKAYKFDPGDQTAKGTVNVTVAGDKFAVAEGNKRWIFDGVTLYSFEKDPNNPYPLVAAMHKEQPKPEILKNYQFWRVHPQVFPKGESGGLKRYSLKMPWPSGGDVFYEYFVDQDHVQRTDLTRVEHTQPDDDAETLFSYRCTRYETGAPPDRFQVPTAQNEVIGSNPRWLLLGP
jgi:hypothetical protein